MPKEMIAKRLLVGFVALGVGAFLVVAGEGIQRVRAQQQPPSPNPHGTSTSTTEKCADCHDWHPSPNPDLVANGTLPPDTPIAYPWEGLLVRQLESALCYDCHDGSASSTNIQRDFTAAGRRSTHPVLQARDGALLECSDCHAQHQDPARDVMLLYRETTPGTYVFSPPDDPIGDTFCYGCHGSASELPAPFGDKGLFETSIHATDADVVPPTPGTDVRCSACHEPHASDFTYLTRANEEDLCFTCHTSADPNTANGSNPKDAFSAAANDYATDDGDGIRIYHHPIAGGEQAGKTRTVECASCHNSHAVTRAQTASDPARARAMDSGWRFAWEQGSGPYNRSPNAAAYCGTCHVSPTASSPLSASRSVPYDISLVNDTAQDTDGLPHDAFDLDRYSNGAASAHGNPAYRPSRYLGCPPGQPCELACTACHDFHGSSNAFMLREDIVSPDYRPLPITAATWTPGQPGEPGTVELTVGPHGIAKDWIVRVSGMSPSGYDGTWTVTDVTATTVVYSLRGDPGPFVRGGSLETGGPEDRPSTATITGFGGLDTAADQLRLQTFCLTCHLERSSAHGAGTLCTTCHNHSSSSVGEF